MKINTAYPYPVLSKINDDYTNSIFETSIDVREEFGELIVEVNFNLKNDKIQSLIDSNDCVYTIHIECSPTSYRKLHKTSSQNLKVSIPIDQLRGKIEIYSFVVADKRIENYTNDSLNEWFKGIPITFEKGNFIAIGDAIETTLFEDNMEFLNLPSIVNVARSQNEFMEVELGSDLITIFLPDYEYTQYGSHANSLLKNTILSSVILPAIVQIFTEVNENSSDYQEFTWYQVLEKVFEENNMRLEEVGTDSLSALKAAQLVLRKPLKSSFQEIETLNNIKED